MSTPVSPASSSASGEEKNVTPGPEEKLQQFWERNRTLLIGICVVVLLAIVARGGWDYLAAQKEHNVEAAYAKADTPAKLKSFAEANSGHELAGVAWLQLGDQAYAAEKGSEAVADYQKAAAVLKHGPLADRTQLGLAMAQLLAGQSDAGKSGLKALVDNEDIFKGVRVEAAYQLASLAHQDGHADQVKQYADRMMQIDPSSPWSQRVQGLRADEPAPAAAATTSPATPAAADANAGADSSSTIKLNIPSSGGK